MTAQPGDLFSGISLHLLVAPSVDLRITANVLESIVKVTATPLNITRCTHVWRCEP